jgi:hypothetical protein
LAPESVAGLVKALPPGGRVVVEDPYGAPPAVVPGTTVLRMPVMTRAPADEEERSRPDTTVGAVSDGRAATLVATEAGIPLYRRLSFTVTSTATWYIRGS